MSTVETITICIVIWWVAMTFCLLKDAWKKRGQPKNEEIQPGPIPRRPLTKWGKVAMIMYAPMAVIGSAIVIVLFLPMFVVGYISHVVQSLRDSPAE